MKQFNLGSKGNCCIYELNISVKGRPSQIWLLILNAEIWEASRMRVISRLNSNKQDLVEVVRALKAENKVWLMFVPAKQQQKIYATPLESLKTNRSARDLFWDQIQNNEGMIIDCRA